MAKRGGKSKLTPTFQKKVCEAIEKGATLEMAARYGGASKSTFMLYMRRGREGTGTAKETEFYEAVEQAKGKAAMVWLDSIDEAAKNGEWRAALEMLRRRYPNDFGDSSRLDIKSESKITLSWGDEPTDD